MNGFPVMGLPSGHHSMSEREAAMGKVGRWVTDPKAGAYCTMTLDSGVKVIINHEKGGFKGGWLRIERVKLLGLSSDPIFACNLDSDDGKTAFRFLTRDAQEKSLEATPLGAFVKYLQPCRSVDEVKARVASLAAIR
jgi:hypothetical protein